MKSSRNVSDARLPVSFDTGVGKPYPAYKASGVEWLGEVPVHWGVATVKRHYSIQLGKMLQNSQQSSRDIPVPYLKAQHVQWLQVQTTDLPTMWANPDDLNQFGVEPGDLLVCEGGEGGRCGILHQGEDSLIIQNALHRVRPRIHSLNKYLQYVLSAASTIGWLTTLNEKATIAHFTKERFGYLKIPAPPLPEQIAIARFLDSMDQRITRYICAKEKLIALLEEYRQVVVSDAVTGRFDVGVGKPYPAYKPSGVEWLGEVPAHWEVRRLKKICRMEYGDSLRADTRSAGSIPVFGSNGCVGLHDSANTRAPCVVIGRKGSFGKVHYSSNPVFAIDTAFFVDNRFSSMHIPWLYYTLQRLHLDEVNNDSAVPGLAREEAYRRLAPVPPLAEQIAIARFLDQKTGKIENSIAQAKREIELLREYRTRLIADVATGKRDVREVAAKLPACQ